LKKQQLWTKAKLICIGCHPINIKIDSNYSKFDIHKYFKEINDCYHFYLLVYLSISSILMLISQLKNYYFQTFILKNVREFWNIWKGSQWWRSRNTKQIKCLPNVIPLRLKIDKTNDKTNLNKVAQHHIHVIIYNSFG